MLEPERRHLLLDSLRPPPGYVFDGAVGTSFTLDLVALLVTPVAFALFDAEGEDGRPLANPIAVIEAVRRHANRITVYCQAGEIAPPSHYRAAYAYLEKSVVPVAPRSPGGIFHPKVWVIRFRRSDGDLRYRFLCLSRNLTFDRAWDTILRLDGELVTRIQELNAPLQGFLRSLPHMAVGVVADQHQALTHALADELGSVKWEPLPDGLTVEAFWPMGHEEGRPWPFPAVSDRMLVISPFVDSVALGRLCIGKSENILVSRVEALDRLGQAGAKAASRCCVLQSVADLGIEEPETTPERPEAEERNTPQGLHAKLFVADEGARSRIWTGSGNATMAAFLQNVEFLVELQGRQAAHGVASLVEARTGGQLSLGNLLEDYFPPAEAMPESASEKPNGPLTASRAVWRRCASARRSRRR